MSVFDSVPRPLDAVDRIERLDAQGITAVKAVTGNEPFFVGHYPGHPIYPGVFLFEAVHQAALYFAHHQLRRTARLAEVRSIRFLSAVGPGDTLQSACACRTTDAQLAVDAECRRGEHVCAQVKLIYRLEEARPC